MPLDHNILQREQRQQSTGKKQSQADFRYDRAFVLEAVASNPAAIKHALHFTRDREFVLDAVELNPEVLFHASYFNRNRAFILEAVGRNPEALFHAAWVDGANDE